LTQPVTIAIDAMGGDHGPAAAVPAALEVLAAEPDLAVLLVGRSEALDPLITSKAAAFGDRLSVRVATEVVAMGERPQEALRRKKNSSMRVAIDLVKAGEAHACVSAGNTGALMAIARFVLKTIPGIDRPAIISRIPARRGHTHMLDLGANADCTPEHLLQFAVMGSVIATDLDGVERPKIGLLNIGEEDIKGDEVVRDAARLLGASTLNYVGFVEGDDIFSGEVDVVVTDGFTGNVALKTMEGLAGMIGATVRTEFTSGLSRRIGALTSWPALRAIRRRLDPRAYNGAGMVGLAGVVIKSHGGADAFAFGQAIRVAMTEARHGVPTEISKLLEAQGK
jgi:glycerol-3-phosphate acyltransferase PlsX